MSLLAPPRPASPVGTRVHRVEGRAKVTGRADYAADRRPERLAYAVGVVSTIAAGRLTALHTAEAEKSPGVLTVLHHRNFDPLKRSPNEFSDGSKVGEVRLPFEDENIHYAGQWIAVVVAERFEQARMAARLIRSEYSAEPPLVSLDAAVWPELCEPLADLPDKTRGDPAAAWAAADVRVDGSYRTATEVHCAMEPHATTADWRNGKLFIHDSTQWVVGVRKALGKVLGIPARDVIVQARFVGGGFGGKLFPWAHTFIAAVAARRLKRPVKMVLERRQHFTAAGHRPATRQRIRLAARRDGTLVSIRHDTLMAGSQVDDFTEPCGEATKSLYRCANVGVTHRLVRLNIGNPTPMRAPGAAPGTFPLECAMDELASSLGLDPIELRRRNEARRDENAGKPWSSKHLLECYEVAARRFGWSRRRPEPGSMREGGEILGWGFAAATWPGFRQAASIRVELRADGTAAVFCATQDPGTGTYTVAAQIAAEILRLPMEKIEVVMGDSSLPEGPISGGSMVTSTVVPAVAEAARQALAALRRATRAKKGVAGAGIAESLAAAGLAKVEAEARVGPEKGAGKYSIRSFGAHCAEVRWDPGLARLRVSRVVSAFDAGRIISRNGAENQIHGSIVMGMGMALHEASIYDPRTGRVVTDNLADYLVPVNADTPKMDVTFVEHPDRHMGEYGARGVGELAIAGVPAAIVNAIHHATGRRFRDIPIRIDDLLTV